MRLSDAGRQFLQGEEGLSLKAYPDPPLPKVNGQWQAGQLWSVGYGHQLPMGTNWEGHTITRAEADRYFLDDVLSRELGVSALTPIASQPQFDAMVSLAYNIGLGDLSRKKDGGFATSTVQRLHNAGDYQGAADAFRMWRKSAGAVNPVLEKRRERERAIYLNGYPGHGYSQPPMTAAQPAPIAWSVPSPSNDAQPSASLGSAAPVAALAVAGAGLVFFCPSCSASVELVGVEVKLCGNG